MSDGREEYIHERYSLEELLKRKEEVNNFFEKGAIYKLHQDIMMHLNKTPRKDETTFDMQKINCIEDLEDKRVMTWPWANRTRFFGGEKSSDMFMYIGVLHWDDYAKLFTKNTPVSYHFCILKVLYKNEMNYIRIRFFDMHCDHLKSKFLKVA